LDAWWEERAERHRLEENLLTVQQEFRELASELRPFVENLENHLKATEHLMSLTGPDASSIQPDSLAILTSEAMRTSIPNVPTGALSFLVASGEIHLIRNGRLRLRLGQWSALVEDAVEQMVWLRRDRDQILEPVVNRYLPLRDVFHQSRENLSRSRFPSDPAGLLRNPDFEAALADRLQVGTTAVQEFGVLLDSAEEIAGLISEEIM
jgi:hypothetical protein